MTQSVTQKCLIVRYGLHRGVAYVRVPEELAEEVSTLDQLTRRGSRVVIDCGRGPEIGETLGLASSRPSSENANALLVRLANAEDELLNGHLERIADRTLVKCNAWLEELQRAEVLLEVEPLLDAQTVFFHFLEPPDESFKSCLEGLLKIFESELASSDFVKKVISGCGPGCGTSQSVNGCGSSCSGCAVKCSISKRK